MHRLVIALTTFLGLTAATYLGGYLLLFGGTADRAAELVPADAAIYVNVYLEPSAGQQMNLSGLVGQLPGFADEAALDEKIDQLVQNLLAGTGIDYRADVKPWLGGQAAVAAWFDDPEDPATQRNLVVAAVRDEDAAREALDRLVGGSAGSIADEPHGDRAVRTGDAGAYALVDGMAVIGTTADAVRAALDAAGAAPSLTDRPEYRDALASLPADHLASGYVDLARAGAGAGLAPVDAGSEGAGTLVAVLVAERDGLRVVGRSPVPDPTGSEATTAADPPAPGTLAAWIPEDVIAEVTLFDVAALLADAEAAAAGTPAGDQVTSTLDTLRAVAAFGLGISLDDEILPLLDGEAAVALTAIEGGVPRGLLVLRPADSASALETLERLTERMADAGGSVDTITTDSGAVVTTVSVPQLGEIAYAAPDGVLMLGLDRDDVISGVEARAAGRTLAEAEPYRRAFAVAGARAGHEAYADVTAIVELLVTDALPGDTRDILSRLGGFALSVEPAGDHIEFRAALTLDQPGAE